MDSDRAPSKADEPQGSSAASFEGELGGALRRAGDAFSADAQALADGGLARGRARKRRRAAAVAGGALALAAVVVGGAVLGGAIGGGGAKGGEKAGEKGTVADRGASKKTADGGGRTVTGKEMIELLTSALPGGRVSGAQGRGLGPKGAAKMAYAHVVYDDGQGAGAIDVRIGTDGDRECPDPALAPYTRCTSTPLSDGAVLVSSQGYEYPDRRDGIKLWEATLATKDGRYVTASEWNAPVEKGEPITRDDPPLDLARMTDLVRDARWAPVLAAVPPAGPTPTPTGPTAADIKATFRRLLPKGPTYGEVTAQEGVYAHVTADDGKGASLVEINVQPNMLDVESDIFRSLDVTTLPDGTKFAVSKGPGEKGGAGVVVWTVDTIRTDGLRVVVSATNSGSQLSPATRATPALTIAQLKAVALAEDWRRGR
ncbi:hypothetical protein [Streptomyces varsoviensis]|uniref:Lipoprotein n=1 Tax=Streptomyces varsoviensis TaxID=67373 RepID=A0ABR5JB35_9ACTN|nr:hypothetical protein [Streptomyces varsoviensis]KOG90594.1 hypothetical protein ADK38_07835 [Streptomyces varsoviensis]